MSRPGLTGSRTIGPFFGPAMLRGDMRRQRLDGPGTTGQPIRIEGQVRDGDGAPVPDALIEIWQANAHGRYAHPGDTRDLPLEPSFTGFGRAGTDVDGHFWFETIKPGVVPAPDRQPQARHLIVTLFARGLLNHVVTRLYFADDPDLGRDLVLARVPIHRRVTLMSQPEGGRGRTLYRWNVNLQGDGETAFFNL